MRGLGVAFGVLGALLMTGCGGEKAGTEETGVAAYPYRAVLLDVARKYHSIETLKFLIDECEAAKINIVQLHLTDDQNWMFPTETLAGVEKGNQHGKPPYTKEELKGLEAYAAERGVMIVPEIDLPGHSSLLVAYDRETFGIGPEKGGNCVNFAAADVREAIKGLLDEVLEVFEGAKYVHIGGDEASFPAADQDEHFSAAKARLGEGADNEAVFAEYLGEICDWLIGKGRTPVVWEGFRPTEWAKKFVSRKVLVISWEAHYYPPSQLVEDGWDVVNAGWDPLYVVDHFPGDNFTMAPVERFLRFDPNVFRTINRSGGQTEWRFGDPGKVKGGMLCWWEGTEENAKVFLPPRIRALGHALYYGKDAAGSFSLDGVDLAERPASEDAEAVEHLLVGAKVTATEPVHGFEPEKLVDGSVDRLHYWMSYGTPVTVLVEPLEPVTLSEVTLVAFWDGRAACRYLIEATEDGEEWFVAGDGRENEVPATKEGYRHSFEAREVKALRVTAFGSSKYPTWAVGRMVELIGR